MENSSKVLSKIIDKRTKSRNQQNSV